MHVLHATAGLLAATLGLSDPGNTDSLQPPFRVKAADRFIDVGIGHAAPLVTDWDGDGVADLLVGQFENGCLRVYRNTGSGAAPSFDDFAMFQTRSALGSIPSG